MTRSFLVEGWYLLLQFRPLHRLAMPTLSTLLCRHLERHDFDHQLEILNDEKNPFNMHLGGLGLSFGGL